MLFNSYEFIFLFLPVSLLVFFYIGNIGHHRIALSWLVGVSLFFYAWWNPAYLGLLLFSLLFNYACGVALSRQTHKYSNKKKLALWIGVGINLSLLGYFKYTNFLVDSINAMTSQNWHVDNIILPLAISFFTFQQIAYLVDAYRGETREYNFLHYSLFVVFFPQLIAGPIVHHREMLPQFAKPETYRPQFANLAVGITIFVIGLFKKVVIADTFAGYASPVFQIADSGGPLNCFQAWEGAISYTLQLYFDFSGYSDMAIGLARLFGIRLPLNFNAPYQACNIIEFWRRWHMTLSRFLRDYLYIALGGNRKGELRRHLNLLATMLLGGLWHGAGWNFVVWGGLHGVYLIINHVWQRLVPVEINRWWSRCIAHTVTLLAVVIGWVFFRATTFDGALSMLNAMINLPSNLHGRIGPLEQFMVEIGFRFDSGYLASEHYVKLGLLLFWLWILTVWPTTQQLMKNFEPAIDYKSQVQGVLANKLAWRPNAFWSALLGIMAVLSILHLGSISEFLYFQF
ncbi:MBOAT family O-acyltransferase [Methylotuvimicrobium sp.]|uniref:MBOAT family O-acyltransferase n=1 Tax=Methylotuvimicrobium sp. TaxID=2822413 RepID=UPI003D65906C